MFAGIGFCLASFLSCVSVFVFVRCVCVARFVRITVCMQVQGMLPSPRNPPHHPTCIGRMYCMQAQGMLPSPPTHPTHPTYPHQIRLVVCMQVQGMLPSPPTHPTRIGRMCASPLPSPHPTYPNPYGRMCASPRYLIILPPHPPNPLGGCMQVQGMLPSPPHPTPPTHPPTHPTQRGASERKTEAQVIHARRK